MKLIKRQYLDEMISVIGTQDIKILSGVRRAGKSTLMEQFADYVQQHLPDSNLIQVNFNLTQFIPLQDWRQLDHYVTSHYQRDKHNFILIDEVQMCSGFEIALNSWHAQHRFDIFVTGSNAFLLSSNLATVFTGRTYILNVYPFSFAEYRDYFQEKDWTLQESFDNYFFEGGLAGSFAYPDRDHKYRYLNGVYETLILRDIMEKNHLANYDLIDSVSNFLIDNIGSLTNANKIAKTLTSHQVKTNHNTISSYLHYLTESFAFYQVRRYDVQGKRYLYHQDKYYLSDHGFKYARLGSKNENVGHLLENIVAIELLRRGYEIFVGQLPGNTEIDFIATKRGEKIYIQVCQQLDDEVLREREIGNLLAIKDAYPKMIITRQDLDGIYEGVQIVNIARWLTGSSFPAGY